MIVINININNNLSSKLCFFLTYYQSYHSNNINYTIIFIFKIMILKFITNSTLRQPINFKFASAAAAAAIDYYSLLGVERGATTSQI